MSKKYTAKQYEQIIRDVLCGALEHMEAIKREIGKIGPIKEDSDPNLMARAKVMHLTLTCINDIIHPAHKLLYKMFSEEGYESYFDVLVKNHKEAIEKSIVPACYCSNCDPDKLKAKAKFEELSALKKEENDKDIRVKKSGEAVN
jgi:hypothetical protein